MKFVPYSLMMKHFYVQNKGNSNLAVRECPNVYGFHRVGHLDYGKFLDEDVVSWGCDAGKPDSAGIKSGRMVILAAIKIMTYLGFKRIYLLGCDFSMEHDETKKGTGKTYAFPQYKHAGGVKTNNDCYKIFNQRFHNLRPYFEQRDIKIFNCTPNSKLDAFPVMDLSEAVERATKRIPDKINTYGYYGGTENKNKFKW